MVIWLCILAALFLGILAGIFTGLAPGIHINLVSALLVSFSSFFLVSLGLEPIILIVFLVALAITHTFIDFIPSVFLGAPDEDNTALSVLPGHEMLMQGKAYPAVIYTLYGSLAGIFIILLFFPLFFYFLPVIYSYAERIMPFILILASIFLVFSEKGSKLWALIIFFLSGFLGIATLNLEMKEPLLPLFTGLFGLSSLITSINKSSKIPKQEIPCLSQVNKELPKKSFLKSIFASIIASPLCSFLPGMGSGQAAVIGSEVTGELDRKEFLVLLGAINTIVTGLAFIALYTINKARTGIAVSIQQISELSVGDLWIILGIIFLSGIISFFIGIFIAKYFSGIISKINYKILSISVIIFLLVVCFIFSGFVGILVSVVSAFAGLVCIYSGVRRTHMMGCLLLPTILLYLL